MQREQFQNVIIITLSRYKEHKLMLTLKLFVFSHVLYPEQAKITKNQLHKVVLLR